ncbi:hypothetical protein GCM10023184_43000 [Flaviaesturariibacter amylovorans]|uniref:Uncharacterized protein n=2 Tax=Flaviaesturariibacter amylovorans TaxID=1084520 RepID=A0ABP8HR41_9BACT
MLLLLLLASATAFAPGPRYKEYCNGRFGFCVPYPADFRKERPADNGGGNEFTAPDGKATVFAWGMLALEEFGTPASYFNLASTDVQVTYKVLRPDGFIFSGIDKEGNIVYQKTVRRLINYFGDAGTPAYQHLRIRYPAAQKARYAAYCALIAKSL